ncbi:MAG TPA: carboxypeptidase-like regulatory domain-containing protein, partial [Ignavibacteria bacterium]|nr:carboxypeptidase-like regulatory domain-containing protein [Ignavibacteria bacterium]
MYSRYFVLLCVFALTVSIYSQTEIEGYIYDSLSGEPIHDAEVMLLSTGAKTESDVSGFFQLVTFSQNTQKIRVKMQGYKEISLDVLPGSGDINVLLQPKEITISQIDVTARKEQGTLVFGEIDFKLRPVNTSQDLL